VGAVWSQWKKGGIHWREKIYHQNLRLVFSKRRRSSRYKRGGETGEGLFAGGKNLHLRYLKDGYKLTLVWVQGISSVEPREILRGAVRGGQPLSWITEIMREMKEKMIKGIDEVSQGGLTNLCGNVGNYLWFQTRFG